MLNRIQHKLKAVDERHIDITASVYDKLNLWS